MMLLAASAAALAAAACAGHRRWRRVVRRPRVYAGDNARLRAILEALPALREPYVPPCWCHGWWAQLYALTLLEPWRKAPPVYCFDLEPLGRPDGGECALAWARAPEAEAPNGKGAALAPDAPVVCIFHTITASMEDPNLRRLCGQAFVRGFRPVALLRRGHLGRPLLTAKFHIVGHPDDAREQVRAVRRAYPGAIIFGLGVSAGTGVLVRMLGEDGPETPLAAAVCISPGFDTGRGQAFKKVRPIVFPFLKQMLTEFFLEGAHAATLEKAASEDASVDTALRQAAGAVDMDMFYEAMSVFSGYGSVDEMHAATNPMGTARNIKALGLAISAVDDPICTTTAEYLGDPLFDGGSDPRALVLTSCGSHCTFFDGWSGRSVFTGEESWAERLAFDFFAAACGEPEGYTAGLAS